MFFDDDHSMIRFLESQGYNITYVASTDLEVNPNVFNGRRIFLSNWHDEYWSKTMRDRLILMRDSGKHLAFFDSNNILWQIRFETSTGGAANRVIVCYKDDPDVGPPQDPIVATNPSLDTTQWRVSPVTQPENALQGIMFESGSTGTAGVAAAPNTSQYSFTVRRASGAQGAATVPLTVATACGNWQTLVGGGPAVFQSPS